MIIKKSPALPGHIIQGDFILKTLPGHIIQGDLILKTLPGHII